MNFSSMDIPCFAPLAGRDLRNCPLLSHSLHQKVKEHGNTTIYKILSAKSPRPLYLKIYRYPRFKHVWSVLLRGGLVGKSRARIEYANLSHLHAKGLAPRPLLVHENRPWLFLSSAYILMEEVVDGEPMDHFMFSRWSKLSFTRRRSFVKSLAHTTRAMNQNGFVNGEYHWRNILVIDDGDDFSFQIIDPCAHRLRERWFFPYTDLATLGIYSEKFFSTTEQMLFFKTYLGHRGRLTARQRKLIARILQRRQKIAKREWKKYARAHRKFLQSNCPDHEQISL